ncbi:MAG TPA: helix-turn-helix domain-containing protein [Ktedonobacteraceae bacterium]|nr:helix-turn-helix domain-containing protein [Ktedonobacteraceae bacterium]
MSKLLSITDVAQSLGVSERTVYRLMDQDELHPFKMGKYWKFDQSDVEAYLTRLRESSAKKSKANKKNDADNNAA